MNECAAKLSTQPAWVPDWVWAAYGADRGSRGARELLEAKHVKSVWTALARRSTERVAREQSALSLFWAVNWALDFSGEAVLGSGERRRRAQAVIKAADALADALREADTPGLWTMQFADDTAKQSREMIVKDGAWPDEESFAMGAWLAAREVAFDLPGLVAAQCKDTLAWAEEAVVERPNKPTAARSYFVRSITSHFFKKYGEPLRGPTLSLASVFFDCQNWTTADITSLAPVADASIPSGASVLARHCSLWEPLE